MRRLVFLMFRTICPMEFKQTTVIDLRSWPLDSKLPYLRSLLPEMFDQWILQESNRVCGISWTMPVEKRVRCYVPIRWIPIKKPPLVVGWLLRNKGIFAKSEIPPFYKGPEQGSQDVAKQGGFLLGILLILMAGVWVLGSTETEFRTTKQPITFAASQISKYLLG